MRKIHLSDAFSLSLRCKRAIPDRYVKQKTRVAASIPLSTDLRSARLSKRFISDTPIKILDAPGVLDDFYANLLSWSQNGLFVALSDTLYCYSSGTVSEVISASSPLTSVYATNNFVVAGCSRGVLRIIDRSGFLSSRIDQISDKGTGRIQDILEHHINEPYNDSISMQGSFTPNEPSPSYSVPTENNSSGRNPTNLYSTNDTVIRNSVGTQLLNSSHSDIHDSNSLKDSENVPSDVRSISLGNTRVGALSVRDQLIACGHKDGRVSLIDLRVGTAVRTLKIHSQEVTAIAINANGRSLATGSNDNSARVCDLRTNGSRVVAEAKSAIKGLNWCPWKFNELAVGCGTSDRTLRLIDVNSSEELRRVDTQSQVCALAFASKTREIITAHGFRANSVEAWQAQSLRRVAKFGSHDSRVLSIAVSPDGSQVASIGADENLKFWELCGDAAFEKRETFKFR